MSWGDIIERARKIVSFIDLAGHEKYLRTTVAGMTGSLPDYALLVIGANMGVTQMTKEHLGLCVALKIPVIVVLTKVDMCPENVKKDTISAVTQLFKNRGLRKNLFHIRSDVDVVSVVKGDTLERFVPVFEVSSVTGLNLDLLRTFLNLVPPRLQWSQMLDKPAEVLIDRIWQVDGVGTVVGGMIMAGQVTVGQNLLLGPDPKGHFTCVTVKSIHIKRVNVKSANAGQSAGFALKRVKKNQVRRGMVMCAADAMPKSFATWTFEADVVVLHHATTIAANYEPCVQCLAVRQTAKVISIQHSEEVLRAGDRARVTFRFKFQPEYLKPGMRLIFRDGKCKGIGIVASVTNDIVPGTMSPLSMSGAHGNQSSAQTGGTTAGIATMVQNAAADGHDSLDKSGEFSRTAFVSV
jgi:GTPase